MALDAIQQLKIIGAFEGAPQSSEVDLLSLVLQNAVMKTTLFIDTTKDVSTDAVAERYLNKVSKIHKLILQEDSATVRRLRRLVIAILGDSGITYSQVQSASDGQWTTFVYDNMDEAVDYLAGVIPSERLAYDTL